MNTTVNLPYAVNATYNRMMLERAQPELVHGLWAQIRDIPKKGTDTIKFRKMGALPVVTTPLVQGVTPLGKNLSVTDVTVQVKQYGDFVVVTDWVDMTGPDNTLLEAAEVLGEQAGQSLDAILATILNAGTNVQYAAGRASRVQITSADKITATELRIASRTMRNNNAKYVMRMVNPDQGYATTPVKATFVGIAHVNTFFDLEQLAGWKGLEEYQRSANNIMPGERGAFGDIRFVETTAAKVFTGAGASGIDVYSTLIIARDAYGVSRISGEAMRNIVKGKETGGTEDPLEQRITSGWKATFGAAILQQLYLLRIEHAVSA